MKQKDKITPSSCPCGSKTRYADCCEAIINGYQSADTAETLMRSRYSAYVLAEKNHLLRSWHPAHRPDLSTLTSLSETRWLSLRIVQTNAGGPADNKGSVEFVAKYKGANGRAYKLHERSEFIRENNQWYYVCGDQLS